MFVLLPANLFKTLTSARFVCLVYLFFTANVVLGQNALPKATLIEQVSSHSVDIYYNDIYLSNNRGFSSRTNKIDVSFNKNSFCPALVQFAMPIHPEGVLEAPSLAVMPGDSIRVKYNFKANTYDFTGNHQAELDFCKKLYQKKLSIGGFYFEMSIPKSKIPLDEFLNEWHLLKQDGEATISELAHTAGIRPQVATFLARQIRLRIFSILLLPATYQQPQDPLREFTPAYNDSVAANVQVIQSSDYTSVNAAQNLTITLKDYVAYKCVSQGKYPTLSNLYNTAKQEYKGFERAWVCFAILERDGKRKRKDISRLLANYQTWVSPYTEFVHALKGDRTMPIHSYKPTALADSLQSIDLHSQLLADLLANHRGKVVLLDLWASWCAPCLEAIPTTAAIGSKYKDKGLVVVYLSTDRDPVKWQKALKLFPKNIGNQFLFLHPTTAHFLEELEINSVPRYILIDRNGTIRYPDAPHPSDPDFKVALNKLLTL